MYLQYGNVVLKVVELQRFDRECVYSPDGADLLTIRVTLGVAATYAPGGDPRQPSVIALSPDTQAVLKGNDNTTNAVRNDLRGKDPGELAQVYDEPQLETGQPGYATIGSSQWHSGPQTDAELRYHLMIPRQKLILWAYDRQTGQPIRWLESPRSGFTTDAANGPLPIGNPVVSAVGEPNSIGVYFEVQTDVLPCATGSDRLVLSHRWQSTHIGDENNYLTRVTRGTIVFNAEYVHTFGIAPDAYRNQFVLPIPIGFERKVPEVTLSPDGLTIRYTITDTDPTVCFDPGDSGATQMEIAERLSYNVPWANNGTASKDNAPSFGRRLVDPFNVLGMFGV